jgi:rRNA maturation endonuclease Nob1
MVDAKSMQKKMTEMQNSDSIADLFGKLVSGRKGYKAVIEVSKPAPKCSCGKILEGTEKFCPECGAKTNFAEKK